MKETDDKAGIYIVLFSGMIWGLGGVPGQILFRDSSFPLTEKIPENL